MKQLIETPEDKLKIRRYLLDEYDEDGRHYKSSYYATFKHARQITGRDEHGLLISLDHAGDWSGACMYMILIDHIGGMFRLGSKPLDENIKDFRAALETFTDLSQEDIEILRQLRNSFLHKFNLYYIPDDKTQIPWLFSVGIGDQLIDVSDLARKNGGGKFNDAIISIKKLGDLVEGMHQNILQSLEKNELIVRIHDEFEGLDELLDSNTIVYASKTKDI